MATKAPSKTVEAESNTNLEDVVRLNTEINQLNVELKGKKVEFEASKTTLKEESKLQFDTDLGYLGSDEDPHVFGNHEYVSGDHLITVNYKMDKGGMSFTKIGGRDAVEVLTTLTEPAEYKKLFKEVPKLNESAEKLIEVHSYRPDLVGFNLNARELPEAALVLIREKWPEAFTPVVKNEEEYIQEIDSANVETEVHTSTGFISKVAALSEESRFKLRDFLRKVLGSCVTSSVKCGNRADA